MDMSTLTSSSSPSRARFPLIDSCRALAALSVLAFHVGQIGHHPAGVLGQLNDGLAMGVPVFFLISGFVLYRPFVVSRGQGRTVPLAGYARRRVLRIVPAYWVALTVLAVTAGLPGVLSGDFWRYYGFLQIYDAHTFDQGLGVAWTLCIEVTFYALLPLYALLATKVRREAWLLGGLALASIVFRAAVYKHHGVSTLPGTFFWFVPGMMLALLSTREPGIIQRAGRDHAVACWTAAAVAFVATCYAPAFAADLLTPVVAFLFVLPAIFVGASAPGRVLSLRPLPWLGGISYAIYLYHATVMAWLADHGAASWPALAVSTFVFTVAAAAGSWYVVEQPAMRWRRPQRLVVAEATPQPVAAEATP